jgi:malate synthase
MTDRVTVGNLRVAATLYDFVNDEALPGTDIDPDTSGRESTRSSPI